MSFIHHTLVGHFDPRTVHRDLSVSRPIDAARVARLLAEYPLGVAGLVAVAGGYAECQWAPARGFSKQVYEFAYRLAREECCLAVENHRLVRFPPEAAAAQQAEWERLFAEPGHVSQTRRAAPDPTC
jgi:hypothetical protein